MKLYLSKIDANILSESVNKDNVTVEVEVSGLNLGKIIIEVLEENISKMFEIQEDMSQNLDKDLLEKVKTSKVESRKGSISLTNIDNNWIIDEGLELSNLIFGNIE